MSWSYVGRGQKLEPNMVLETLQGNPDLSFIEMLAAILLEK